MSSSPANVEWDLPLIARNAGAGDEFYYEEGELYANCLQSDLNTAIAEYDPIAATNAKKVAYFKAGVQAHMDSVAQGYDYDNIFTAVSYSTSTHVKYGPEGIAFRDWRDLVWDICTGLLADWESGGSEPELVEVLASLPAFAV